MVCLFYYILGVRNEIRIWSKYCLFVIKTTEWTGVYANNQFIIIFIFFFKNCWHFAIIDEMWKEIYWVNVLCDVGSLWSEIYQEIAKSKENREAGVNFSSKSFDMMVYFGLIYMAQNL